jgi:hypothetical protein
MTLSKITKAEAIANLARCRNDFAFFAEDIIGIALYDYQREILHALSNPDDPFARIAWHTGHGVGKTLTMACAAIAFLFTRVDAKVITTASVNRQVRDVLWPEIHRWMSRLKPNLHLIAWHYPYNLLDQKLEISQEWYAIGASSDTPENMEGFHAPHVLYIVDEAKTVDKGIFEAIEGALTGREEARLAVVSTPPLAREGHFYDICSGRFKGWKIFHTSGEDSPNVSKQWIADRAEEWGETSPVYISKVLGLFPDSSENTLIPASWIEKAQARWSSVPTQGELVLGVDVARYGDDETAIAPRIDNYIFPLEIHVKQDTMQTAGNVMRSVIGKRAAQVSVDTIGLGAGVYDRLREVVAEQKIPCALRPINVAQRAPSLVVRGERLKFKRLRDYMYWCLREKLDPVNCPAEELLSLPPDRKLGMQLSAIRYKINSDGTIEIESKDDLKKRGYSSPDRAEAVMMAVVEGYQGWTAVIS